MEILERRGVHDYGILRAWGGNAFWNFRRQGGDKTWKPSVVGYGYFLELPNKNTNILHALYIVQHGQRVTGMAWGPNSNRLVTCGAVSTQ